MTYNPTEGRKKDMDDDNPTLIRTNNNPSRTDKKIRMTPIRGDSTSHNEVVTGDSEPHGRRMGGKASIQNFPTTSSSSREVTSPGLTGQNIRLLFSDDGCYSFPGPQRIPRLFILATSCKGHSSPPLRLLRRNRPHWWRERRGRTS